MVYVPVKDEDPFCATCGRCVLGSYSNVVEEAET